MNWSFNKPEIPRTIPSRLDRDPEYAKWKHLEPDIEFLVIVTETFIVYVDKAIDVDWSLRDESGDRSPSDTNEFNAVLNRVASLEAMPCDELARSMKLQFKRLIGEGIARALGGNFKGAQSILKSAEQYIQARNEETSRFWYLSGSALMALPFVLIGCLFWIGRGWLQESIGPLAFWEVLSGCAGALGALLSVIGRTGALHFDCSAGKRLHYLEASSRIAAGVISGLLVGLAVHSQIILTALSRGGHMTEIMLLAGMASGVSERLAGSIIADLGAPKAHKDKEPQ